MLDACPQCKAARGEKQLCRCLRLEQSGSSFFRSVLPVPTQGKYGFVKAHQTASGRTPTMEPLFVSLNCRPSSKRTTAVKEMLGLQPTCLECHFEHRRSTSGRAELSALSQWWLIAVCHAVTSSQFSDPSNLILGGFKIEETRPPPARGGVPAPMLPRSASFRGHLGANRPRSFTVASDQVMIVAIKKPLHAGSKEPLIRFKMSPNSGSGSIFPCDTKFAFGNIGRSSNRIGVNG